MTDALRQLASPVGQWFWSALGQGRSAFAITSTPRAFRSRQSHPGARRQAGERRPAPMSPIRAAPMSPSRRHPPEPTAPVMLRSPTHAARQAQLPEANAADVTVDEVRDGYRQLGRSAGRFQEGDATAHFRNRAAPPSRERDLTPSRALPPAGLQPTRCRARAPCHRLPRNAPRGPRTRPA